MDPVTEKKPKRRKKQLKKSADAKREPRPTGPAESTAPAPDLSPSAASRKGACWLPAASPKVRDEGISPAEQWKRYFKRRPGKRKGGAPYSPEEALPILEGLASGLDHAHGKNLVHQ